MKHSHVTLATQNGARMLFVALFILTGCSLSPAPTNPNAKPKPPPETTEQNEEELENQNETGDENVNGQKVVLKNPSAQTPEETSPKMCADVPDTEDSSQSEPAQNDLQRSDRNNGYKGHFIGDGRRNCWKAGRCDAFGNPKNKCDARKNYFGLQSNPEDFSIVNIPPEVPATCGCTVPTK